jgi:hypothetical protein
MKYLLFACSLLLLVSCRQHPIPKSTIVVEGKGFPIYVDWDKTINHVDLSPFVDSMRYVCLETNDSILLSGVKKMDVQEEAIYIQDTRGKIVKYNKAGKSLYAIDYIVLGPKEYTSMHDFCIYRDLIEVLDLEGHKLLSYHVSDGTFAGSVPLKSFFYHFRPIAGHHYLADINIFLLNDGMGTLLLDSLTNQQERLLSWGRFPTQMNNINAFSTLNDSTYGIFSQPDYTIYHYTYPNRMQRKYEYKFSKGLTFASLNNVRDVSDISKGDAKKLVTPLFYMENEELILSQFVYQTEGYYVLYDKKSNVQTTSQLLSVGELGCYSLLPTDTPHIMAGTIPYPILEAIKNAPVAKLGKLIESPLYNIALQAKPEDNPVIQLIYLKHAKM